jgi:hypothetical protein
MPKEKQKRTNVSKITPFHILQMSKLVKSLLPLRPQGLAKFTITPRVFANQRKLKTLSTHSPQKPLQSTHPCHPWTISQSLHPHLNLEK